MQASNLEISEKAAVPRCTSFVTFICKWDLPQSIWARMQLRLRASMGLTISKGRIISSIFRHQLAFVNIVQFLPSLCSRFPGITACPKRGDVQSQGIRPNSPANGNECITQCNLTGPVHGIARPYDYNRSG